MFSMKYVCFLACSYERLIQTAELNYNDIPLPNNIDNGFTYENTIINGAVSFSQNLNKTSVVEFFNLESQRLGTV